MKRVCNKDKADSTKQPSDKDTEKKEAQELNSSKSAKNQGNCEPPRRGSDQTTYEELRKIKITNDVNSENVAGKYESILELAPMNTKPGNQEGKPSNQDIKPGNQGIKPNYQETRLGINLDESDQTYEKINERKKSDKAIKSNPGYQGIKPGNQETKRGYQGEIDQTYAEINKGEDRVRNGEPPVQSKATLNESLHHTYYDPKKPVYGNAAVLKFVGK